MVSLSEGILKIKYTALEKAKLFYEIAFVLNMVVIFVFYNVKLVASVTTVILFLASCWILIEKNKEKIILPYVSVWYAAFIIYVGMSNLWAERFYGINASILLLKYLMILLTTTSLAIYVDNLRDLNKISDLFIAASLIIVVCELTATPLSQIITGSLGSNLSDCNPNSITIWMDFAVVAAFHKAYNGGRRSMYIACVIFIAFCALSSSRKGFAAALAGPMMIILFSYWKKGYVLRIVLGIVLVIAAIYLILENDTLYAAIGRRFTGMYNYMQGGKVDTSIQMREYFADVAKSMFKESPIIGNGIESFQLLMADEYFIDAGYAHNNYLQLLSELGLVGFVLYYGMYAYIGVSFLKSFFVQKKREVLPYLTTLVMMLVLEAGVVSIDSKFIQLVIAMMYCASYAVQSKGQISEN